MHLWFISLVWGVSIDERWPKAEDFEADVQTKQCIIRKLLAETLVFLDYVIKNTIFFYLGACMEYLLIFTTGFMTKCLYMMCWTSFVSVSLSPPPHYCPLSSMLVCGFVLLGGFVWLSGSAAQNHSTTRMLVSGPAVHPRYAGLCSSTDWPFHNERFYLLHH